MINTIPIKAASRKERYTHKRTLQVMNGTRLPVGYPKNRKQRKAWVQLLARICEVGIGTLPETSRMAQKRNWPMLTQIKRERIAKSLQLNYGLNFAAELIGQQ